MALIIGLEGKAKHGKGAASKFFDKELVNLGYSVVHVSFSHIIHEECAEIASKAHNVPYEEAFKWMTVERFKDSYNKVLGTSPRKMMQDHGNKTREEKGLNYFVDKALARIPDDADIVINDSVRFDNEVNHLSDKNGVNALLIHIFNPNVAIEESDDLTENGLTSYSDIKLTNTYVDGSEDDSRSFQDDCIDFVHTVIIPEFEGRVSSEIDNDISL